MRRVGGRATVEPGPLAFYAVAACSVLLYGMLVAWVPLLPDNLYEPLLDLGKITGYEPESAARYVFLLVALFTLYGAGYRLVASGQGSVRTVAALAGASAFVLLWAYPATAADVFGYAGQGHVLAFHGENPFVVPPNSYGDDAILPYLAFPGEPSQYGPLWVVLAAGISLASQENLLVEVLLFKLVGAISLLLCSGLVYGTGRALGSGRPALAGAYLVAANPLMLWEMVGNAHNDGLMMAAGLLAIWLFVLVARHAVAAGPGADHRGVSGRRAREERDRLPSVPRPRGTEARRPQGPWPVLAELAIIPLVALGGLVKLPVLVVLFGLAPALWRRSPARTLAGLLLATILAAAVYAPFWEGPATLTALGRTGLFTASAGSSLFQLLATDYPEELAMSLARSIALLALLAALAPIVRAAARSRTAAEALTACYAAVLAFLLLGITWFQAWYVIWPLALAATLPSAKRHAEAALLSLGAMASYLVFIYLWVMGVIPGGSPWVQHIALAAIIGPLLCLWFARLGARWAAVLRGTG